MTVLEMAREWLKFAQSDLNTASHMFNDVYPKEIEITCYHSQQCAEKSVKAVLIANNIEPPRIHDVIALCEQCIGFDNSFVALREQCKSLNLYGVHARYPYELSVDEIIAKAAIDKAQQVYDFCAAKIDAITPEIENT